MARIQVRDFKQGMDRRRPRAVGVPGALWTGKNVHITRGGDIENAKKFVPYFSVPGTKGMSVAKGQIYVFGDQANVSVPPGVQYQQLNAGGPSLTRVLDAKPFSGKIYAIAQFSDGSIYEFYDGVRITDWDAVADANADIATLTDYLANAVNSDPLVEASAAGNAIILTSRTAGTAFTVSAYAVNFGAVNDQIATTVIVTPNAAASPASRASAVLTITGGTAGVNHAVTDIKANGVSLLSSSIPWAVSNTETAKQIAGAINALQFSHGYSAAATGNVVTISAPVGTGAAPNGQICDAFVLGDVTFSVTAFAGGAAGAAAVAQVATVRFTGVFEPTDQYVVTVNGVQYLATGRAAASGTAIYIRDKRIFTPAAALLRYNKINNPFDWHDTNINAGAGFIAVSSDADGYERIVGAASYNSLTAVFSRQAISIYLLGADANAFGLDRLIENTGTRAPRSIKSYGNNEVFYLDDSGIRSLRARYGTDAPYAADIGAAIDTFVQEHMRTLAYDKISRAVSVIEPKDGRLWVALGGRIYVLSLFPSNRIEAWTYYEPGFEVTDFARTKDRVFARAGDTIYLYGGINGDQWPEDGEIECVVETPFLSAETPSQMKALAGADFAVANTWFVTCYPDPNNETVFDTIGAVHDVTGGGPNLTLPGLEASWAMKFVCTKGGKATLSGFTIAYQGSEAI